MKNKFTIHAHAAVIENRKIISPATLKIEDTIITRISSTTAQTKTSDTIELHDTVLLPGFVNAHCHLELTGPLKTRQFVPWIKNLMNKKAHGSPQAALQAVPANAKRLLASGVTTVLDHVSFDTPLNAYHNLPLRVIAFGEVLGVIPEVSERIYEHMRAVKAGNPPVPFFPSPHAVHSLAPLTLKRLFNELRGPFSIHIAESRAEHDYFAHYHGELCELIFERCPGLKSKRLHDAPSALKYLSQQNLDLKNTLIVHANYLDEEDISLLRTWENCCVVHCPGSFAFFGHDGFDYARLKAAGIPIALGTDSAASNDELNMLREIRLFLERFPRMDLFDFLPIVTTNACAAIGLKKTGRIQEGDCADLIGFKMRGEKEVLNLLTKRDRVDFVLAKGRPAQTPGVL